MIKNRLNVFCLAGIVCLLFSCSRKPDQTNGIGEVMLSTPDKTSLFAASGEHLIFSEADSVSGVPAIEVIPEKSYQEMDGFGYTLTGGSAYHLYHMSKEKREALLKELFGTGEGSIGVSYLRISVGASDLDATPFSYNDLPEGETDESLVHFSLDKDRACLIPVLKEIIAIFPDIKIMGSPWSPPVWMKDNKDTRGGELLPEYYDVYAKYLVTYIQKMAKEGITIDALTVQNEPLHPGNNPSLLMLPEAQAEFVKNHLGPAFEKENITTKIIVYDHNADRPDYPISILNDSTARKYIDGSAFHLYGGQIDALSEVHRAHPDKNLYFTEQWIGAPGNFAEDLKWHIRELIIGASRNWCKTVLEWNLASNSALEPHTDRGGCTMCLGAVTIDGDSVVRNPAYYIIAHASKFVRPGSKRIESSRIDGLPNVAFLTPENKIVLIVLNDGREEKQFTIAHKHKFASLSLKPGAVKTIVWPEKADGKEI